MTTIQNATVLGLELIASNNDRYVFHGEERECLKMADQCRVGQPTHVWEPDECGDVFPNLPCSYIAFPWGAVMVPIGGGFYHLTLRLN